jgi:hypothetical protein
MKHQYLKDEEQLIGFEQVKNDYLQWLPLFQRLGLKPRKFIRDREAVYIATTDGWYRLGLTKYDKEELKWLRNILEYLEERSFKNWALAWQKSIIWEDNSYCYLIQPWLFGGESFTVGDPATIIRVAEILAELYQCGRDYRENKGIPIYRDRWSLIEMEWEAERQKLDALAEDSFHEKERKEVNEIRKIALNSIDESMTAWRSSGIGSIHEHHIQSGTLGHGNLLTKYLVWNEDDFYLINWEHLSFQPRVMDLASLIIDAGVWEADWILFLIQEYSKILPFWPEEYEALYALIKYPKPMIQLLSQANESVNHKPFKELIREQTRKERCILKVRKTIGSQKHWAWAKTEKDPNHNQGKFSMVLSPVESWGDFIGWDESLIQVHYDQKLPSEVIERLTNPDEDRILGGRDGNIVEATTNVENSGFEISEEPPNIPHEEIEAVTEETPRPAATEPTAESQPVIAQPAPLVGDEAPVNSGILQWPTFPKPLKAREKIEVGRL